MLKRTRLIAIIADPQRSTFVRTGALEELFALDAEGKPEKKKMKPIGFLPLSAVERMLSAKGSDTLVWVPIALSQLERTDVRIYVEV